MKNSTLILALITVTMSVSFRKQPAADTTLSFGIFDCSEESNVNFRLTMNPDSTFTYFNNVDPKNIVDIKGTWSRNRNSILLGGYNSKVAIHTKWKLEKNGTCITSRKGMEFSRLCRIEPCN